MKHIRTHISHALKGMAMGIAEVIPGVSGGTIAFITGIYERLIMAIKSVGPEAWQGLREGGIRGLWRTVQGEFLLFLLLGMALGVVIGTFSVTWVLEHYPPMLWAFFFGLIVASVLFVAKQVEQWDTRVWISLIIGALTAFLITVATPAQGTDALWFVFISGTVAISALLLPGVSGSFILLLLGMYPLIIGSLRKVLESQDSASLLIMGVFAAGALLGLAVFSRVLTWLFKSYRNVTLSLLTGFMLGSLNKLWPWRLVESYRINSAGGEVPFLERNVLPTDYVGDPLIVGVVLSALLGFALVWLLERAGSKLQPEDEA
jgi:putative membrane protein